MTKGERIRQRREEVCVNQTDFAKEIGVSKQTLYKYENDIITNIPSDVIERMAVRLGCSPAYIMGWTDVIEINKTPDTSGIIFSYAKKIAELSPENQDSIFKYIDFLRDKK